MNEEEYKKYIEEQRDKNEYYKELKTDYEFAVDNALLRIEDLEQENAQLKQDVEKLAHNMTVQDIYNAKIVQQLKDKDENISNLIKLLIEMVFDDINDLGVYQELVARHLVKLGYIVKEDGFYKELETNKED